jgi:hypothetical protein
VNSRVDDLALAGAAVAAVVAIAAADGPYEPFESVLGLVLAILLAVLYRPSPSDSAQLAWVRSAAAAAVGALVLCLILAFPIDQVVRNVSASVNPVDVGVSWALSGVWLVAFLNLLVILRFTALRPAGAPSVE